MRITDMHCVTGLLKLETDEDEGHPFEGANDEVEEEEEEEEDSDDYVPPSE